MDNPAGYAGALIKLLFAGAPCEGLENPLAITRCFLQQRSSGGRQWNDMRPPVFGALAWELKLASTLAGIDDGGGARDKLRAIVNRISEGFGTRNYSEAVAMLGQCSHIAPRAEQNAGFCCTARV